MRSLFLVFWIICVLGADGFKFGNKGTSSSGNSGCSDTMSVLGTVGVKTGTGRDGAGDVVAKGKTVMFLFAGIVDGPRCFGCVVLY